MTFKSAKPDGYQAPAVEKAFRLLRFVADSNEALRLSDLARNLGFGKSTTHGLMRALVATGALIQNPKDMRIYLGPATVELALKNQNYLQLGREAQPKLDELRDLINETVFFGLMRPWRALIMATSEPHGTMKISSPPGFSIPLLAGALGKVFLSQLNDIEVAQIIKEQGLPEYTQFSITHEQTYLNEITHARRSGYALDKGEYLSGVNAIAVGLGHYRGLSLAIWVVGFTESLNMEKVGEVTDFILATAAKLRKVLNTH